MRQKPRQLPEEVVKYRAEFACRFRMMLARFRSPLREIASPEIGVYTDTVSRIQSEQTPLLPFSFIARITEYAQARNVNLHWLFSGHGPMELPPLPPASQETPPP